VFLARVESKVEVTKELTGDAELSALAMQQEQANSTARNRRSETRDAAYSITATEIWDKSSVI
jgi:hypothetical protein